MGLASASRGVNAGAMALRWLPGMLLLVGCIPSEGEPTESQSTTAIDDDDSGMSTSSSTAADEGSTGGSTGTPAECTPRTALLDCEVGPVEIDCVTISCVAGQCNYEPVPDGTFCTYELYEDGGCWGGSCYYECIDDDFCPEQTCSIGTCEMNQCHYDPLDGVDAPERNQIEGDCAIASCDEGSVVGLDDPTDPEDDRDPCTIDTCVKGQTVHELAPEGTPCDGGGMCDAAGACVAPN